MADEGTAKTLILVGLIHQIIIGIALIVVGGLVSFIAVTSMVMSPFYMQYNIFPLIFMGALPIVFGIIGIVFFALWLGWRHDPVNNKRKLIITGAIAIPFAGGIGGVLVVVGAALAPSEMV